MGSIPEKHQWLLSLIGLKGSIDEGNKQLAQLINSNSNFRYEAIMTKCLLQAYVLNKAALAVETFDQLIDLDGSLIRLQRMVLYLKNSDGENAIKAFNSTNNTSLSYTHYLAGEAFLQKGNYQRAEKEFSIFLELHKGISNKKDALYKIWLCHFLSGDSGHQIYRSNAQSAIEGYSEADRYASRVLNNDQLPNKAIMKIRLATDGGFYEQAERIITQQPILTSKKDTVEYNYRLARLYDKKGDKDISISLYKSVLRHSKDERWYFAANSALMLGYIYIEKRDYQNARFHLKMAMNFKHHEYKNSIDAKAEAALNTISDL